MKWLKTTYWFLFTLLISCNNTALEKNDELTIENNKTVVNTINQEQDLTQDIIQDSIKTYSVVFDTNKTITDNTFKQISHELAHDYDNYQFLSSSNELEELTKEMQTKNFLNLLASDFQNENFQKATKINFSFLVPKEEKYQYIKLEKIYFKDNNTAASCFESLKNYKEMEIHIMSINWIWIQQENSLILISALNHKVTSKQMQTIKQHLIKSIENNGTYNTIQFYE